MNKAASNKARYIMIGGFLGAGKTTAVLALARDLRKAGKRPGLITNDQSFHLVDTAMLEAHGFEVEEIGGGCFCCRFNSLVEASENLSRESRPDAFIAEPVGSCTDLRAAVSYPLRKIYGDDFEVAPLSVLVDPVRAERMLGLAEGRAFAPKVHYVYDKQLEEADAIVINKSDLLDRARLDRLRAALAARYPQAKLFAASARTGQGLDTWFDYVMTGEGGSQHAPEVDYEVYAEGEALLGWLNCTAKIAGGSEFDGNAFVESLAARMSARMSDGEIAHLKMTLSPDEGNDLAVLNLVRNDVNAELSYRLHAPLAGGELIVNLRAQDNPEQLWLRTRTALNETAAEFGARATIGHHEFFRPAKPNPTHRMATV
jgi:Ni2+-binding GTPase involved in maturation of urease and hydrogenase